jgi:hypothetical protein
MSFERESRQKTMARRNEGVGRQEMQLKLPCKGTGSYWILDKVDDGVGEEGLLAAMRCHSIDADVPSQAFLMRHAVDPPPRSVYRTIERERRDEAFMISRRF